MPDLPQPLLRQPVRVSPCAKICLLEALQRHKNILLGREPSQAARGKTGTGRWRQRTGNQSTNLMGRSCVYGGLPSQSPRWMYQIQAAIQTDCNKLPATRQYRRPKIPPRTTWAHKTCASCGISGWLVDHSPPFLRDMGFRRLAATFADHLKPLHPQQTDIVPGP